MVRVIQAHDGELTPRDGQLVVRSLHRALPRRKPAKRDRLLRTPYDDNSGGERKLQRPPPATHIRTHFGRSGFKAPLERRWSASRSRSSAALSAACPQRRGIETREFRFGNTPRAHLGLEEFPQSPIRGHDLESVSEAASRYHRDARLRAPSIESPTSDERARSAQRGICLPNRHAVRWTPGRRESVFLGAAPSVGLAQSPAVSDRPRALRERDARERERERHTHTHTHTHARQKKRLGGDALLLGALLVEIGRESPGGVV